MGEHASSKLRIAIAGISHESSTFAPHRTQRDEFTVLRGADELADRYPYLPALSPAEGADVEFLPLFQAGAMPGGQVEPEAYDEFEAEILRRLATALEAGPLDGFHLDIHGAMCVDGRLDAEGVLAGRIRAAIGPRTLISASLDLHGQVSRELASTVDLLTAFRTAPHIDYVETRERAVRNLVQCLRDGVRPVRAWLRVPVLLPGEKTSTRVEPAKSIYDSLPEIESRPGIIDAALLVGYAWADEPRSSATVLVSGTDTEAVRRSAAELAQAWWDARDGFEFCAPAGPADWAIGQALGSTERPFFISDSGDNPTGGGSDDTAHFLADLLATPTLASGEHTAIWASCIAPEAVRTCVDAGVGSAVTVTVGGHFGGADDQRAVSGRDQVRVTGEVVAIAEEERAGHIAAVRAGGVVAILTERRRAYHFVQDLLDLGLDPAEYDITAIKIGYLQPDLFAHAKGWVLALTPGGVDQHLERLRYDTVVRPMHPLDTDFAAELEPELFAS